MAGTRDVETLFIYRVNPFRTYERPLRVLFLALLGGVAPVRDKDTSDKQAHHLQSVLGSDACLTVQDMVQQQLECEEAKAELSEEQSRAQMGRGAKLVKKIEQTVLEKGNCIENSIGNVVLMGSG